MPRPLERLWACAPWAPDRQAPLIRALGLDPLLAQLLLNRGVEDPDAAQRFLQPSLGDLPDPFRLADMDRACERVRRAAAAGEEILVYGDYDVDGTSAASLLAHFLGEFGLKVRLFLPDRERDGYGLNQPSLARLMAERRADVVITCDNGTSSHEAIEWAASQGIDVVVTDHHSLPDPLPPAAAVLNPRRPDSDPAWAGVCGAGIAFAFTMGLRRVLGQAEGAPRPNLKRYLDLVTLGTIADVVPLTGVNRLLVWHGLRELHARHRPGLRSLLRVSGVMEDHPINSQTVGFRLGPRLNAAGRVGDASLAARLLMTSDPVEADRLAATLEDMNQQRRRIEDRVLVSVWEELARQRSLGRERVGWVLAGQGWHPGVIGIVAARVVEVTGRPSFVIGQAGGQGKGSGRSVEGVDLFQALTACHSHLIRYGGHPMAAGLTLADEAVPAFTEAFDAACRAQIGGEAPRPRLPIDAWLEPQAITEDLIHSLRVLEPFGQANHEPLFATRGFAVNDRRLVGGDHLRLRLQAGRRYYGAIGFRMAEWESRIPTDGGIAVAHSLELNHWQGRTSVQMRLRDLLPESALDGAVVPEGAPAR